MADQARDVIDQTPGQTPVIEEVRKEGHRLGAPHHPSALEKKSMERKDRRRGIAAIPKKSGKGGTYTWEGPEDPTHYDEESVPVALDENDPNYVDEEQEKMDREVAAGVVEVAKVAPQDIGVVQVTAAPQ